MIEYGAQWNNTDRKKIEVLGEKPLLMPFCAPQIPQWVICIKLGLLRLEANVQLPEPLYSIISDTLVRGIQDIFNMGLSTAQAVSSVSMHQ